MAGTVQSPHIPVLLNDVMAALAPQPGEMHVDGTFGAGGYAQAILDCGANVVAIDRDPNVRATADQIAAHYPGQFTFCAGRYADMQALLAAQSIHVVHGITLDIGMSSMHIDQAERGFSFMADGPLDMRMEQDGESAADWINAQSETAIADAIYLYGEEPRSRRIARAIVAARPILRTGELAAVVRKAVGHHPGQKKDPAAQVFQALRIVINDELGQLEAGLIAAEALLAPGGRLAIVSFHSLEDRIVKQFLKRRSGGEGAGSRHMPIMAGQGPAPTFSAVAKPVRASAAELARNSRARSAVLRSAVRTQAAAWGQGRGSMAA
jgi:16S rRNA (cytosine1402-N4)-methyltransferase